MIKPEELRIGNNLFRYGHIVEITGKELFEIWYIELYRSHFEPIPLTEELLVKAGFKKLHYYSNVTSDEYLLGDFLIGKVGGNNQDWQLAPFKKYLPVYVSTLHELQNAYKVFEGTELTIKLNIVDPIENNDLRDLKLK